MTLTPAQTKRLCDAIADKLPNYEDFEWVLSRYVGGKKPVDVLERPGKPATWAKDAFFAAEREGKLNPFLSRVVEYKWRDVPFRSVLVAEVRALVRATSSVTPHVETIVRALAALRQVVGPEAPAGKCQGPATCESARLNRQAVAIVIQSLDQFEALKDLHDDLHVLQVEGADWLDESDTRVTPIQPPEKLVGMIGALRDLAIKVEKRVPPAALESCQRCRDAAQSAAARLAPGAPHEEAEFAQAQIRALVDREPELIDGVMFGMSRDLPIRMLRDLFASGGGIADPVGGSMLEATKALEALSDSLRARILQHGLWQATEQNIRAVTRILADPAGLSPTIFDEWHAIRRNLAALLDTPNDDTSIDRDFELAIVEYDKVAPADDTWPAAPSAELTGAVAKMSSTFDPFRSKARALFLEVDQALKAEFSSLMPLRDELKDLLAAVRRACTCKLQP